VQSTGAADWTANFGAVKCFINDLADGAGAAATLSAAAETTIDMACGAARRGAGSASYLVVAQDVAGTDNHQTPCWGYSLTVALC
jgi:hypothetical protein